MFPNTKTKGEYNISSDAAGKIPGIYTHNSYRPDKVDVFPQKELLEMLMGLEGDSTTTSSTEPAFIYYPQFASTYYEFNGKEVTVEIEYDDGEFQGTGIGKATSRSTSNKDIKVAKAAASLQAKGDLANQFKN